jgi:transposase
MGETRDQAICAARPEDCVGLYLRRDLSGQRKRRRARPTLLQQRGHALHLEEISLAVATGEELPVPGNMTLVPLLPESPELNPVENIWQFMRDNWLSNRVFKSYVDILNHCCFAWNRLIDMPWKIMSIGTREWAYRS